MQIEPTDQDKLFAAELDDMPRHFGALPRPEAKVMMGDDWGITVMRENPVARCGASSLAGFLDNYCGLRLPIEVGPSAGERQITVRWTGDRGEGYGISITSANIEVVGDSPAGALYGAHRLQWMMCENGGPYLPPGTFRIEPGPAVRITSTPFRQPFDDGDDPLTYSDGYLDLMAHYGFNGLHVYIDIFEYVQAPGLEHPDAARRIAALAELARRAAPYNIGIYLHPNVTRRREDDAIFAAHPEMRGAQSCLPGSCRYYCLCGSEPMTARFYAEIIKGIARQAPEVRGVIAIVGGESLLHCYSAPISRELNGTNCPRCAQRKPSEVVAGFANAIARSIWDEFPDLRFMAWPYNGWIWSESPEQREFIALLDKRIGFMTCCEKDARVRVGNSEHRIFDYAICYVGPSEGYTVQRELCESRDLPFYVKTESSIGLDLLTVPYIPAMQNWRARWRNIIADRPQGVLANWRFTGLTGTLSEEVAFHETWRSGDEDTLARIAARLAGDEEAKDLLVAWRLFSRAFSKLAYCPGLVSLPYFTGPMFLGPAHPLILSPEEIDALPKTFTSFDVCYVEVERGIGVDDIPQVPRFFADSGWAQQLGLPTIRRILNSICSEWDKGLALCGKSLDRAPAALKPGLQKEIDVAAMTAVMLRTARYLARFQMERERATSGVLSRRQLSGSRRGLEQIAQDDLANARLGLELAENNYRFGYGFEYARQFTTDLIRAKIDFTERQVLPDIRALGR